MRFPDYSSLKRYEGLGNYALWQYYKFPHRFFYRHKLKMIVNLMTKHYRNVLDFGSGPGIFIEELKTHADKVVLSDYGDTINPLWKFDLIVCASVLEFCELDFTLKMLRRLLTPKGEIIVGSPMQTKLTEAYFWFMKDGNIRHSHLKILEKVSAYFKIEEYREWLGLYFALRGAAK